MKYTVRPTEYHRGYCPTICDTRQGAEEELALMRKHTTFEWEIVEELDDDEEELQRIEDEAHVRLYQRYYDDEDDGIEFIDDDDEDEQVYHVAVTYEAWNGEQVTEHKYKSAAQAAAVYERVCRIMEHKGYKPLGYGECWERVYETTDSRGNEVNYTVELY